MTALRALTFLPALVVVAFGAAAGQVRPAPGAPGPEDAYLDFEARALHTAARVRWQEVDHTLLRYQATVSQRLGVGLRLPLRDRTLFHHESAARVVWERGEDDVGGVTAVQLLGLRNRLPDDDGDDGALQRCEESMCGLDGIFLKGFEPRGDPLILGLDRWNQEDQDRVEHPLADGAERHYRFRTGRSLTVSLPDGRAIRTVELEVQPRRDDPFLISGALWIEPESGALVRAAFHLARPLDIEQDTDARDEDDLDGVPGLLRPVVVDISLVAVDYALWDLRVWMPHALRVEGTVRMGILSAPVSGEIAYAFEEVVTVGDTAGASSSLGVVGSVERLAALAAPEGSEWRVYERIGKRGRSVRYLVPSDPSALGRSPLLPDPIWSEDPAFVSVGELRELAEMLADLPGPVEIATVANFDWGTQRPDLIRYNRVEGASLGARASIRFGLGSTPISAVLTARVGHADMKPRGTLVLAHETLTRSATLSLYRELHQVEPSARALGVGNSLSAFLFGRDDGDYYEASGFALAVMPPVTDRSWYRARTYVERQDAVARETDASVLEWIGWDDGFRPTLPVVRADQAGLELALAPWWGADPERPGVGFDLFLQGERGDFTFERLKLGARTTLPLLGGGRLALSVRGGTTWGEAPPQRSWVLGGPTSLRGYAPGVLNGPTFLSGRGELILPLSRVPAARAIGLALFADGGWAGDRDAIRWGTAIASAGIGLSALDGVLRLDAAWGWKGRSGRRLDLYLDGLL